MIALMNKKLPHHWGSFKLVKWIGYPLAKIANLWKNMGASFRVPPSL
jgi:hypothetical protein